MKSSLITYCLLLITCYSSSFVPLTPWETLAVQAQTVEVEKIRAQQLLQRGIEQAKTNQLEAALQSFQEARIIYQGIQDFLGEGQALNYLSLVYSSLKDYTKAIDYQQQVLAIARSLEDPHLEWSALSTLVSFFTQLEDEQKIIEFAQQGLILARESQNSQWEWAALSTLASTYSSLENYEKVVEYAQQGLVVAQEVQNPNYEV
ncbi:MAG: tetratricopeptide repeat protein, partial [Symploca sp. SIO1B1]|nr:tetratricopeptide repeat protein [Symploca sp. SIO1B1]